MYSGNRKITCAMSHFLKQTISERNYKVLLYFNSHHVAFIHYLKSMEMKVFRHCVW